MSWARSKRPSERSKLAAPQSRAEKDLEIGRLNEEASQLLGAGNAKAAAEKYQRAVQINPRDAKLRYNFPLRFNTGGSL